MVYFKQDCYTCKKPLNIIKKLLYKVFSILYIMPKDGNVYNLTYFHETTFVIHVL